MDKVGLALAGLLLVLAGSLPAQKAEPVRIQFQPGSGSTVVRGRLRGRQQMEYVAGAQKHQKLTLQLASTPAGTLQLKVRDPDRREVPLQRANSSRWTAVLPQAGDYDIWVMRASRRAGTTTYKLKVTIQ